MRKPKVHFFIGDLRGGGAERAFVEIVNHLDRRKLDLTLILAKKRGTYLADLKPDIPIVELLDKQPVSGKLYVQRRLISHLRRTQPDAVVGFTTPIARFMLIAQRFGPPTTRYVVVEQNNVSLNIQRSYPRGINGLMQRLTRRLYRSAHRIVAVSHGIADNIIRDYRIDATQCRTVYNPVNVDHVRTRAHQPVLIPQKTTDDAVPLVVAVGRLVPQKGYPDMIEAWYHVNQRVPCQLLILGEGGLRAELEDQVRKRGLQDRISMPGFVDNPWVYLAKATLFLSTSHWEGFSLAHVEAMACGVPLVLTDCDFGPKELIVSGENGVLVPVGDVPRIAAAVAELLQDKAQRKRITDNATQYVKQFDSTAIARAYEKIIEELFTL